MQWQIWLNLSRKSTLSSDEIIVSKCSEEVNHINEACKLTCHEFSAKYEVEIDKEDIFIEEDKLIIKKEMKNKEIMRWKQENEQKSMT